MDSALKGADRDDVVLVHMEVCLLWILITSTYWDSDERLGGSRAYPPALLAGAQRAAMAHVVLAVVPARTHDLAGQGELAMPAFSRLLVEVDRPTGAL